MSDTLPNNNALAWAHGYTAGWEAGQARMDWQLQDRDQRGPIPQVPANPYPATAPGLTEIPGPWEKNDPRFRDDGTFYLMRYLGRWYAGEIRHQWYGWNFHSVYDAGLQLNSSGIEAIYEIEGLKATEPEPIIGILANALAEAAEEEDNDDTQD